MKTLKKWRIGLLVPALLTLVSCSSELGTGEQAEGFRPAQLTGRRSSLENLIQFPRYEGDVSIELQCYTRVSVYGTLFPEQYCESEHEARLIFTRAIERAIPSASLTPAKIDDREYDSLMAFTVRFNRSGDEESIEVFLHHFQDADKYGEDYIAPQLAVENTTRWNMSSSDCSASTAPHWMGVQVSATGEPLEVMLLDRDEDANEECIEYTHEYLANQKYIPAMNDGEFVEGLYKGVFNEDYRREFRTNE